MTERGQRLTSATYRDRAVIDAYVEGARHSKMLGVVDKFAQTLSGARRVIDIDCGPGHHAYRFAENGCVVTSVDSSPAMVNAAIGFKQIANSPRFEVADMRNIGRLFPTDSFDGAWISDSLFHIPEDEVPSVLEGVGAIVVNTGPVFIAIKAGSQGTRIVEDHK